MFLFVSLIKFITLFFSMGCKTSKVVPLGLNTSIKVKTNTWVVPARKEAEKKEKRQLVYLHW